MEQLIEHFGAIPSKYPIVLTLAVSSDWDPTSIKNGGNETNVYRVSPEEADIAFVMAAHRDIDDDEKFERWRRFFLSVPVTYKVIDSNEGLIMQAAQLRQDIVKAFHTMRHTCLQMVYNVLHFKTQYETRCGPASSKVIADAYMMKVKFADDDNKACQLQSCVCNSTMFSTLFELMKSFIGYQCGWSVLI